MHPSTSLIAITLTTALASAQCFESNLGVPMPRGSNAAGVGDDVLFDLQPLTDGAGGGIPGFPMGGIAASYTHAQVQSNGVMFLTTGAASGATTQGYSSGAAGALANLQGSAGQPPRLAVYWKDLDILAANGGGVFFNNTIPGKFVVTWQNAVHYGTSSPVFTLQAQLYVDGHTDYYYSGAVQNPSTCPIVGISIGNAVANPGVTDLSAGAHGASTSGLVYETFATANTFDLADRTVSFTRNGIGGYDVGVGACVAAASTAYGQGCVVRKTSLYENFAAGPSDLGNSAGTNSIHFAPNGNGGYLAANGGGNFFTPVAADLGLGDDGVSMQALPFAFPFAGGSTMGIGICANGFVWLDPAQTSGDFHPSVTSLLNLAPRLCPQWGDLNPTSIDPATTQRYGSIHFDIDPASNDAVITWWNVPQYDADPAHPRQLNTFQVVLSASGDFEFRYRRCASTNALVIGFSEGGAANDPGPVDLSAAFTATLDTGARRLPLQLGSSGRPVLGAGPVILHIDNVPAATPLAAVLLSFTQLLPGVDLAPLGAPGCFQYANFDVSLYFTPTAGSGSVALPVPAATALSGLPFFAQAAAIAPAINALGLLTSNGIAFKLGVL